MDDKLLSCQIGPKGRSAPHGRLTGTNSLMDADLTFAALLRRYRLEAGLTQEELAERAGLSANGLSALERGSRQKPHRATVDLLAQALSLAPADSASLSAAARGVFEQASAPTTTTPASVSLGAALAAPLIGRAEELERIRSLLDSVQTERGHFLLLTGELGVGKTRLFQELTTEALARDFSVVAAACEDPLTRSSYLVFRRCLAALCGAVPIQARTETERKWELIRERIQSRLTVENFGSDDDLPSEVIDLVLTAAAAAPVAMLVDDVQTIDLKSLELLHHLAGATRNAPVLIACSLRSSPDEDTESELSEVLQKLSRDRLLDVLAVRRLSYDETAAFLSETMGGDVSEEIVAFAHRRTGGNPRLLDGLVCSLGGRLQLQGEIGAGAMGRVFRAYDSVLELSVAAKLILARAGIDMGALLRFKQEGAVLRSMSHPNIVQIYDTFVDEYAGCIIMELLDGRSLTQVLAEGPLSLERTKMMALQIADALAYAHSQSIVHRDIKPENVMVLDGDAVKVMDFGIARILPIDMHTGGPATTGMHMGTPLYMAPEQIEGKRVDPRSDVYGFGAVLYHMITGRPPFEGDDPLGGSRPTDEGATTATQLNSEGSPCGLGCADP